MRFSLPGRSERRSVYSIDPPLAYPGLSVRIVAFAGDFLALVLLDVAVAIVVGFPIGLIFGLAAESIALLELGLWLIARFLYFAFWESSSYCATPGARACHLQVFDEVTGDPPTFSQASLRSVCRFFSAALFGLGWLPVFLRPKRRALHDILSGWVVVRHEPRPVVDALLAASPAEAGASRRIRCRSSGFWRALVEVRRFHNSVGARFPELAPIGSTHGAHGRFFGVLPVVALHARSPGVSKTAGWRWSSARRSGGQKAQAAPTVSRRFFGFSLLE